MGGVSGPRARCSASVLRCPRSRAGQAPCGRPLLHARRQCGGRPQGASPVHRPRVHFLLTLFIISAIMLNMTERERRRPDRLRLSHAVRGDGSRASAGRKKRGSGVPHLPRSVHARFPLHVTLRVRPEVWQLRSRRCFTRPRARVPRGHRPSSTPALAHFSVQHNHVHMLVETTDARALARAIQGMCIRMAKGLNRVMGAPHGHRLRRPLPLAPAPHTDGGPPSARLRAPTTAENTSPASAIA